MPTGVTAVRGCSAVTCATVVNATNKWQEITYYEQEKCLSQIPALIVRFKILTAANMKMDVALMMEAASTSKTSVNFYQITWGYNREESHVQQPWLLVKVKSI
jgi:hypothetical protein